jgi:streptogramin lyase
MSVLLAKRSMCRYDQCRWPLNAILSVSHQTTREQGVQLVRGFIGIAVILCGSFNAFVSADEVRTIAGTGEDKFIRLPRLATKMNVGGPFGITIGPDGALYVCETVNHVLRRIDPETSKSTIVAGTGKKGYSGDGGPATKARLNEPYEIRFDAADNMFFVEMQNHLVRRVDAKTGKISTVAGTGKQGFRGDDGPATSAQMSVPHSIALDNDGQLYICDIGNHRIRRVHKKTGVIQTISGNGKRERTPDGRKFKGAPLNGPRTIDFDKSGAMWLALREGNQVFRLDMKRGTIHHIAGTGKKGFTGNGGPAKQATLSGPKGIAIASNGDVYLCDTESNTIRMIDASTGRIELVCGTGERGDGPDGDSLKCKMGRPHGVFIDHDGSIFIGDSAAHRVRVLRRVD